MALPVPSGALSSACEEEEEDGRSEAASSCLGTEEARLPMGAGPSPPSVNGSLDSPAMAVRSHQKWGLWTHWRGLNGAAHVPRACHGTLLGP